MKLFDTHAHCDDSRIASEFEGGTDGYIKHQLENGVSNIVNIGTNLDNSRVSISLAEKFPEVYASCGIHPYDIRFYTDVDDTLNKLEALLSCDKVVALGEIGLDYHYEDSDRGLQKIYFERQMQLAQKLNIPVIIHDRDAHGDCMEIVRRHPEVKGVFHSFSGSAQMAEELVDLGYMISFSGTLTFTNARKPKEAAAAVPLDRILIETDCPYLAPHPKRGTLNHSGNLSYTATMLASIKGISPSECAEITENNAKRFYGLWTKE
jgi:TatD DNase family protein